MGQIDDAVTPARSLEDRDGTSDAIAEAPSNTGGARAARGPIDIGAPPQSGEVDATVAHIAQTRSEMEETIHAIQEKLTPSHVVSEMKDNITQAASNKMRQASKKAREKVHRSAHKTHKIIDRTAHQAHKIVDRTADATRTQVEQAGCTARKVGFAAVDAARKRPAIAVMVAGAVVGLLVGWPLHHAAVRRARYSK